MSDDSFSKGVRFSAGAVCFVVGAIMFCTVVVCGTLFALVLLGPAIGNVFSSIMLDI